MNRLATSSDAQPRSFTQNPFGPIITCNVLRTHLQRQRCARLVRLHGGKIITLLNHALAEALLQNTSLVICLMPAKTKIGTES